MSINNGSYADATSVSERYLAPRRIFLAVDDFENNNGSVNDFC